MSTSANTAMPSGGIHIVNWILAAPIHAFTSKTTQERKTVVELRDGQCLSNSLVVFLDGEAGPLEAATPGVRVSLHLTSVRSGKSRGELIGSASREAVESALAGAESV
jgi:hypothetical protein